MEAKQRIGNEVTDRAFQGSSEVLFPFFIFPFPVLVPTAPVPRFSNITHYRKTIRQFILRTLRNGSFSCRKIHTFSVLSLVNYRRPLIIVQWLRATKHVLAVRFSGFIWCDWNVLSRQYNVCHQLINLPFVKSF